MKKSIIYTLVLSTFLFIGCDNESTGDVSSVTNFAVVEPLGDPIVFVESGTTYTDPGVSATIAGAQVPFETIGSVDTSTPGIYDLTYRVVNDDGFAADAFRTVYVYENNGTIAGVWDGKRVGRSGGPVLISTTADPNVFNCSDLNAGHYEFERGFGRAFATPAPITLDGSSITSPGGANGFGNWFLSAGALSGDQKTMTWTITIPAFAFGYDCELTKITP